MSKFLRQIIENYYYHNTDYDKIRSIKSIGLKPRFAKTNPGESNYPKDFNLGLHFSDKEHQEYGNAKLRVHSSKLSNVSREGTSGHKVLHHVPAEHIEIYHNNEWKPIKNLK